MEDERAIRRTLENLLICRNRLLKAPHHLVGLAENNIVPAWAKGVKSDYFFEHCNGFFRSPYHGQSRSIPEKDICPTGIEGYSPFPLSKRFVILPHITIEGAQMAVTNCKAIILGNYLLREFNRFLKRLLRRFSVAKQIIRPVAYSQDDKSSGMSRTQSESLLCLPPGHVVALYSPLIQTFLGFQILQIAFEIFRTIPFLSQVGLFP